MLTSPKICSPCIPGVGKHASSSHVSSDDAATSERVDNVRIVPIHRGSPLARAMGGPFMARAAVERMKLWENGRTLKVAFIDGVADVKSKVAAIAKEWEAVANL
jgi:hypothetical protein